MFRIWRSGRTPCARTLVLVVVWMLATGGFFAPAQPDSWSPIPITQWESVVYVIGDNDFYQTYYRDWFGTGCEIWRERWYEGYGWWREEVLTTGAGTTLIENWNTPRLACYTSGWLVVSSTDASKRLAADPADPSGEDWECAFYPMVFGGDGVE